jgi:hypothetical protein
MILKSSQRASASRLADHLTNAHDNERVAVLASRDLVRGDDVHRALAEMDAISKGTACTQHLHHAMMNPAQELSEDQWARAWQAYEQEFELEGQPFIEVEHHKEGRTHRHRVYDRITEQLKAVEFSWSRVRNEKIARVLEHEFGHDMTVGKHNKAVMARLREDGLEQVADWMEKGKAHELARPVAEKDHTDHQIEKRTGLAKAEAEQAIRQAWGQSDSGQSLKTALEQDGLLLARGNRRDFVVVDMAGATHSLGRRVGEKAKAVKQRMADLDPASLPDVGQAREMQLELARSHEQAQAERKREQEAAKEIEATPTPPEPEQAIQQPPEADKSASHKRKRKQEIQAKLDQQEKQREEEKRRRLAAERRQQREEQRRLANERAAALVAELEEREKSGIVTRTRTALGKVAGWMRGLVKFGRSKEQPQPQKPDLEARREAGDAAEITQKSEQQRQPDREQEPKKSRRQIIDRAAITKEREAREAREKAEGKDKGKEQEQDKGIGLKRGRDDSGGIGGDDDPFT